MHIQVKELPQPLQDALKSVEYYAKDVAVEDKERTNVNDYGGDGYQAFTCIVNLHTGRYETTWGSWGGPNMFNPHNAVDLDNKLYAIPVGGAVINGRRGGTARRTYASVYVHPDTLTPLLPASVDLTPVEKACLYAYDCLKSGPYRQQELLRAQVSSNLIESLVQRGFLKRNKSGSVQITTEGKNARR